MNKLVKSKGDVYQYVDGGVIHGYTKSKIPEGEPFITWKGARMPHSIWQSVLAFFVWTFEDTKKNSSSPDEAVVYFYYNENEKSWLAWAPPQRGSGMTVNVVEEHPNRSQDQEFIDYVRVGTAHHHCSSSAFQSGTDKNDEESSNGIHITVGKLDKNLLDLHARVVFNGNMIEITKEDSGLQNLADWIEIADKYKSIKGLPSELEYTCQYYSFKSKPPKDLQFPEAWKENYLKWGWNNNTSYGNQGSMGFINRPGPEGKVNGRDGYYSTVNGIEKWTDFSKKTRESLSKSELVTSGNGNGVYQETPVDKAEEEFSKLIMSQQFSTVELWLIAKAMDKLQKHERNKSNDMARVNKILNDNGLNPAWLIKWLDHMVGDVNENQAWMSGA